MDPTGVTLLARIGRERAVIAGFVVAVAQAFAAGELTKATAVPVIVGIALRFFVEPYHRIRPDKDDQADHGDPAAFHEGR